MDPVDAAESSSSSSQQDRASGRRTNAQQLPLPDHQVGISSPATASATQQAQDALSEYAQDSHAWIELQSPEGWAYYENQSTGETKWAGEGDWERLSTEEGHPYWFNAATAVSVWDDPDEIAAGPASLRQMHGMVTGTQHAGEEAEQPGAGVPDPAGRAEQAQAPHPIASGHHRATEQHDPERLPSDAQPPTLPSARDPPLPPQSPFGLASAASAASSGMQSLRTPVATPLPDSHAYHENDQTSPMPRRSLAAALDAGSTPRVGGQRE